MTISDEKSRLRFDLKARRATLGEEERVRAARTLCDRLFPFLREQGARNVGVYLAQPVEISLDPLVERLLEAGVVVSAPRLYLEKGTMNFVRLCSLGETRLGSWKLREPSGEEVVMPDWVLAPGVGFDESGRRLGMGGGWYDRTFVLKMVKIGVCFDCQIVPRVPVEKHDWRMNWVFSDARTVGPLEV